MNEQMQARSSNFPAKAFGRCSGNPRILWLSSNEICGHVINEPHLKICENDQGQYISHDNRRLLLYQWLQQEGKLSTISVQVVKNAIPDWQLTNKTGGLQLDPEMAVWVEGTISTRDWNCANRVHGFRGRACGCREYRSSHF